MAKKKEPPKPMYPLRHEYDAALQNVFQEMSMLLQIAKFIADKPESMGVVKIQENLRERVKALEVALYGDQ